jgi:hypothetical protein
MLLYRKKIELLSHIQLIAPATGDEDESLVAGVTWLANAEEDEDELPIDIADAATSEEYVGDEELEEDEEGAAVAEEEVSDDDGDESEEDGGGDEEG